MPGKRVLKKTLTLWLYNPSLNTQKDKKVRGNQWRKKGRSVKVGFECEKNFSHSFWLWRWRNGAISQVLWGASGSWEQPLAKSQQGDLSPKATRSGILPITWMRLEETYPLGLAISWFWSYGIWSIETKQACQISELWNYGMVDFLCY